ncbi:hypothetical protein CEUSTIGMA_g1149.t1 [Chlamydomonas eustigma]|uniref:Uncharacterized protein n=1 Tax=Chlamydomonas eustigma TaxID=1157962 RepID=A0A250WS78_9CHLO|nr:hypothetical protein CEUSTIGMA_g1149.t1 [Chlamydomonas eustigma]|eukprot:GAX73697.1 hypothetical protein CEUSTIGMA_g1149.t1 [Chlamydomonas eustigma]
MPKDYPLSILEEDPEPLECNFHINYTKPSVASGKKLSSKQKQRVRILETHLKAQCSSEPWIQTDHLVEDIHGYPEQMPGHDWRHRRRSVAIEKKGSFRHGQLGKAATPDHDNTAKRDGVEGSRTSPITALESSPSRLQSCNTSQRRANPILNKQGGSGRYLPPGGHAGLKHMPRLPQALQAPYDAPEGWAVKDAESQNMMNGIGPRGPMVKEGKREPIEVILPRRRPFRFAPRQSASGKILMTRPLAKPVFYARFGERPKEGVRAAMVMGVPLNQKVREHAVDHAPELDVLMSQYLVSGSSAVAPQHQQPISSALLNLRKGHVTGNKGADRASWLQDNFIDDSRSMSVPRRLNVHQIGKARVGITTSAQLGCWIEDPELDMDEVGDWVPEWASRMTRQQLLDLEAAEAWRMLRAAGRSSAKSNGGEENGLTSLRLHDKQVRIFKGGGYIMADLISMIRSAGLSHVMTVTQRIHEADCVVVKERWGSGRHVNLKQHRTAALNRGIPFIIVESLRAHELVLKLKPLLLQLGLLHPSLHGWAGLGRQGAGRGCLTLPVALSLNQRKVSHHKVIYLPPSPQHDPPTDMSLGPTHDDDSSGTNSHTPDSLNFLTAPQSNKAPDANEEVNGSSRIHCLDDWVPDDDHQVTSHSNPTNNTSSINGASSRALGRHSYDDVETITLLQTKYLQGRIPLHLLLAWH